MKFYKQLQSIYNRLLEVRAESSNPDRLDYLGYTGVSQQEIEKDIEVVSYFIELKALKTRTDHSPITKPTQQEIKSAFQRYKIYLNQVHRIFPNTNGELSLDKVSAKEERTCDFYILSSGLEGWYRRLPDGVQPSTSHKEG